MESYEQLTGHTDDEIIEIFNANREQVQVGKQWYLDELVRRRQDRAASSLENLTRQLLLLTVAIAILSAVGAAAAIVAAFRA